ncbi:hypothetical protein CONLIGDRAFT_627226 [Coniochaeta ligniaria NRRL 30616]|uniref:Secreted protein n=1 Tax=Coniochaeta ligniaria NRRL 30616 TaxID=1408157 RepID=A0A1J7K4M2_9PEZI|nr:hypothetical protein CONLIGDRAFT_627226 [Coniochaeta ligniaria NRRL 30616]
MVVFQLVLDLSLGSACRPVELRCKARQIVFKLVMHTAAPLLLGDILAPTVRLTTENLTCSVAPHAALSEASCLATGSDCLLKFSTDSWLGKTQLIGLCSEVLKGEHVGRRVCAVV